MVILATNRTTSTTARARHVKSQCRRMAANGGRAQPWADGAKWCKARPAIARSGAHRVGPPRHPLFWRQVQHCFSVGQSQLSTYNTSVSLSLQTQAGTMDRNRVQGPWRTSGVYPATARQPVIVPHCPFEHLLVDVSWQAIASRSFAVSVHTKRDNIKDVEDSCETGPGRMAAGSRPQSM